MALNTRKNLVATIVPVGGDNPLKLRLQMNLPVKVGLLALGALVAQGGTAPYAYSITSGALPTGLSLNSVSGAITGTPTVPGQSVFLAEVQDSSTPSSLIFQATFEIDVEHALQWWVDSPLPMEENLSYSYDFHVLGSTGTLTWSSSGSLPSGITLNSSTGILSGTPAGGSAGNYSFVVSVADSGTGDSISVDCNLTVYAQLSGVLSNVSLAQYHAPFFFDYTGFGGASSGVPPINYSFSNFTSTVPGDVASGSPPLWLVINGGPVAQFSGTPPGIGLVTFTITATDTAGGRSDMGVQLYCNYSLVSPFDGSGSIAPNGAGAIQLHSSDSTVSVSGSESSGFVSYDLSARYTQSGTGAVSRPYAAKAGEFISVYDFGAVGNGVTDDSAAINNAIASFTTAYDGNTYSYAGTVWFPPGKYFCASTIQINRQVRLLGAGSPAGNALGISQLLFADNITGLAINHANVPTNGVSLDAAGAMIDGLYLKRSTNIGGTLGHGIKASTRCEIRNCLIDSFRQNGINIVADSGGSPSTNANNWRIQNTRSISNGGHGFYCQGGDVNAGTAKGLDCSSNSGVGIYDSSFLGNTYDGCHTASNVTNGYKTDNANARNVFLGCYSEGGETHSVIFPSVIYGGILASVGLSVGTASIYDANKVTPNLQTLNADSNAKNLIGGDTSGVIWTFGDNSENSGNWPFRMHRHTGGYYIDWANTGNQIFGFVNSQATIANSFPRDMTHSTIARIQGSMWIREGMFFGTNGNFVQDFAAIPSGADTYKVADWGYYRTPVAGGYFGALVTVAGTPGTWVQFAPTEQAVVTMARKAAALRAY